MRFESVHHVAVAPLRCGEVLYDPAFAVRAATAGGFAAPELLDHADDGRRVVQRLRHRYVGPLPPGAGRFIDSARLSWVSERHFDRATCRGSFVIRPDHYADRLRASGDEVLEPDGEGTRRVVTGDLRVSVPLVAGRVERAIVDGFLEHLAAEAVAVPAWLGTQGD